MSAYSEALRYPSRILFCSATEDSWMALNMTETNSSGRPFSRPFSIMVLRMLSQRDAWTIAMLWAFLNSPILREISSREARARMRF